MTTVRSKQRLWLVAVTAAMALSQSVGFMHPMATKGDDLRHRSPLDVDVAVSGVTFRPILAGPPTADGLPPKGTTFIINGLIYPAGTFARRGLTVGILPDGSPEFPELVIGTWTCRGWFSEDLLLTTTVWRSRTSTSCVWPEATKSANGTRVHWPERLAILRAGHVRRDHLGPRPQAAC